MLVYNNYTGLLEQVMRGMILQYNLNEVKELVMKM